MTKILLADSMEIGERTLVSVASIKDINLLIADWEASSEKVGEFIDLKHR